MPRKRTDQRVEQACFQVWESYRTAIREKSISVKRVWEQHIPPVLNTYPKRLHPKDSWFTKRVREWERDTPYEELPQEPIVRPFDENWGDDPRRVFVLTVLFDHAERIFATQKRPIVFEGFKKSVSDWIVKLSHFFDLDVRRECLLLILFANLFAHEQRSKQRHEGNPLFADTTPYASSNSWGFSSGLELLIGWRRYKMEIETDGLWVQNSDVDKGEPYEMLYLWHLGEELLEEAVVNVGGDGTFLLMCRVDGTIRILTVMR